MTRQGADKLRLRATTQIRNDYMLSARKRLHLTQKSLASLSGTSIAYISSLERLQFPSGYNYNKIESIAGVLEIPLEWVMPEMLTGWKGRTKFLTTAEVKVERLLEYKERVTRHFLLPSPDKIIEKKDDISRLKQMIKEFLSVREQQIINLRYGLNDGIPLSLTKVGKEIGIKRAAVCVAEVKAVRKLEEKASKKAKKLLKIMD